MDISGHGALVTGGASGLGAATAAALAAAGARVTVLDLQDPGIDGIGFVHGDVTSEDEVARAVEAAAAGGDLRVAVSCAGIATPGRVLGRDGPLPLETFARVVQVNLVGTFNVLRLAAARMAQQEPVGEERGVIVNTASIAAYEGQIGQAAYASSKAGVAGLTLPAARELAARAIRVVAIAPGLFDTPLLAGLPDQVRLELGATVPHPSRLGRPEEYAALVRHVIENPMLNGEVVRLDGALRMPPR